MDKQGIEQFIHREIPICSQMGIRVEDFEPGRKLCLAAPLAPNRNDKGTGFGGSIASIMTLAGWGLIQFSLEEQGIRADTVIHYSSFSYRKPARSGFEVCAEMSDSQWQDFVAMLETKGKARMEMELALMSGGETAAHMQGRFVSLAK